MAERWGSGLWGGTRLASPILRGTAIGAGVGAIPEALVHTGVREDEATYYEEEVREGRTLVTVRADGRYAEARDILRRRGAYEIEDRARTGAAGGRATATRKYSDSVEGG